MKIIKVTKSILKSNKGLFFGIGFMYLFATCILMICCTVPDSLDKSINDFFEDYNLYDASATSYPIKFNEDMVPTDSTIKEFSRRIYSENQIEFDGNHRWARLIGLEDMDNFTYQTAEELTSSDSNKQVFITENFAKANDIHAGDWISIKSVFKGHEEQHDLQITKIVSTPEAIRCCRDDTFFYESNDYGYMYINRDYYDDNFKSQGIYNLFNFKFNEDATKDEQQSTLDNFCNSLNAHIYSSSLFVDSEPQRVINTATKTVRSATLYLPLLVFIIILVTTWLFFQQIIKKQSKTIGLLKSIGFKNSSILLSNVIALIIVWFLSTLLGTITGNYLSWALLGIYKNTFCLPDIRIVFAIYYFAFIIFLLLVGLVSLIFSIGEIGNTDPALALTSNLAQGSQNNTPTKLRFIKNAYTRIGFLVIMRNKSRFFVNCLSIAACFILITCAVSCIHSKNNSDIATFNDRLHYDLFVYYDNTTDYLDNLKQRENIETVEEVKTFTTDIKYKDESFHAQINALDTNSELITPVNSKGENTLSKLNKNGNNNTIVLDQNIAAEYNIKIGDTVTVNNYDLEVVDLAKEYVNIIQYIDINNECIDKENLNTHNCAALKFKATAANEEFTTNNEGDNGNYSNATSTNWEDSSDSKSWIEDIFNIYGIKYMKFLNHQRDARNSDNLAIFYCYYIICFVAIVIGIMIVINLANIKIHERMGENVIYLCMGTKIRNIVKITSIESLLVFAVSIIVAAVPSYFLVDMLLKKQSSLRGYMCFDDVTLMYAISILLCIIIVITEICYMVIRYCKCNVTEKLNTVD